MRPLLRRLNLERAERQLKPILLIGIDGVSSVEALDGLPKTLSDQDGVSTTCPGCLALEPQGCDVEVEALNDCAGVCEHWATVPTPESGDTSGGNSSPQTVLTSVRA